MFLFKYGADKNNRLTKELSLISAEPSFYISMPNCEQAPVFDYKTFPFEIFNDVPAHQKRGQTFDHIQYLDIVISFDIETTTISNCDDPYAFMYQWQVCVEDYVFMGCTWDQFIDFYNTLSKSLDLGIIKNGNDLNGRAVVFYVFNLSFEFQFCRHFIGDIVHSLVTDKYCPLLIHTTSGVVYRCAYRLTNRSLESFTKGFEHEKLSGDLDYSVIRVPHIDDLKNGLSDTELAYCYNDVKGCCEALRDRFERDNRYTIASIPLTSTGYVRKDCQRSMKRSPINRKRLLDTRLSPHLYKRCRAAFRGGNTHSNARWTNVLMGLPELGGIGGKIHHKDIASSYPAQIMKGSFPLGPFIPIDNPQYILGNLNKLTKNYCLLVTIRLENVEYIGSCGVPYISKSKTIIPISDKDLVTEDNGRIFKAPRIEITCTEIDLKYILRDYSYTSIKVMEAYKSHKGRLPYELRRVCLDYYKAKTLLKHVTSDDGSAEYNYARAKELLNSTYGLMVMRLDRIEYEYTDGDYIVKNNTLDKMLDKFYDSQSSFLPYQYGLWVTSAARAALQEGLDICGPDTIYCDTDSVFYIGDHEKDFEELNKRLYNEAQQAEAIAPTQSGELIAMGIWDSEPDCVLFKTLGAKKYLLSLDGEHILSTIAGVNKKLGAEYFTKHGFEAFTDNTCIKTSGKLQAIYNDDKPHYIEVNGVNILTASNVALIEGSYTIHIKHDYNDFMEYIQKSLNKYYK